MNEKHAYLAVVTASALVLGGCNKAENFFGSNDKSGGLARHIETKKNDGGTNMLLLGSAQLFEQEGQTVVNIQVIKTAKSVDNSEEDSMDSSQFPDNDPFYEFFKRPVLNMPDIPEQDKGSDELNFGPNFTTSRGGYILTNTHVVANMVDIKALLNGKRAYSVRLIGSDQRFDVALAKTDTKDLPVIKIGDPKDLKSGEWVAAIGAPSGFGNSIIAGIASAKDRSLPNESYTPLVQTDVVVNPGNSGGPLFNLKGQVVDISSQIYSRSGGLMGISFAIPIDVVMNVADQIKKAGKVQRGQLGVIAQEVLYNLAKSFGLGKADDVLVAKIIPNSPATQAGLQVGNIMRSINGEEARTFSDLPVMVGTIAPGKEVRLGIWHKDEEISVKVQLGSVGASVETGSSGSNNPAR